jgi:hypothetical protein
LALTSVTSAVVTTTCAPSESYRNSLQWVRLPPPPILFGGFAPRTPCGVTRAPLRRPALFRRAHSLRSIAASASSGRTEGVMYDVGTGAPNPTGEHGVTGVLSPDNQSLLYLGANQSLMIWDKACGSTRELRGPKDESLCQSQDWYQHWCEQQRVKRVAWPVEHATQTGAFVGPFRLDW